jgi:hypothetical protein
MPRIYNSDNEPLDYCRTCYPFMVPGASAAGWDCDADHPPYDEAAYNCEECGEALTALD